MYGVRLGSTARLLAERSAPSGLLSILGTPGGASAVDWNRINVALLIAIMCSLSSDADIHPCRTPCCLVVTLTPNESHPDPARISPNQVRSPSAQDACFPATGHTAPLGAFSTFGCVVILSLWSPSFAPVLGQTSSSATPWSVG
jgi:hypothetical protein